MIPFLYACQYSFPADTATETGLPTTIAAKAEQLGRAPPLYPEILNSPPGLVHVLTTPV